MPCRFNEIVESMLEFSGSTGGMRVDCFCILQTPVFFQASGNILQ
jgi:hypothetical protein